jgi:hypothetical protein
MPTRSLFSTKESWPVQLQLQLALMARCSWLCLAEFGTFDELVSRGGVFSSLAQSFNERSHG